MQSEKRQVVMQNLNYPNALRHAQKSVRNSSITVHFKISNSYENF